MRFMFVPYHEVRKPHTPKPRAFPTAVLEQDNWDDYGFKTTFKGRLYVNAEETLELGSLKILRVGQESGLTPVPASPVTSLGADYCSFGGDVAYYEQLLKLGRSIYEPYLVGLGDIVFSDERRARFEDLDGYKTSLMRYSGAERTLQDAARLFADEPTPKRRRGAGFLVRFKTSAADDAEPFLADFDFRNRAGLPHRVAALIGYNGAGKTRLLSNLAIVASAYGYSSRADFVRRRAGRFVGDPPPFKTVIVVSYSAFDTFAIPSRAELNKAEEQSDGSIFGYVYCGLRERADEADTDAYRLKTSAEIESAFAQALGRIRNLGRNDELRQVLRPLLNDASFARIGITSFYLSDSSSSLVEFFRQLSSGHKIVLKILAQLVAYVNGKEPTLLAHPGSGWLPDERDARRVSSDCDGGQGVVRSARARHRSVPAAAWA